MNDSFHTSLRACRERQAFSAREVASIASLSVAEYDDLENVPSEWRMVTPLFKIKVLVRLLKIDMSNMLPANGSRHLFSEYNDASDAIKIKRADYGCLWKNLQTKLDFPHPLARLLKAIRWPWNYTLSRFPGFLLVHCICHPTTS